ncbi:F-box protein PP2-B10-like [Mangifera indica]|uniref:F-box protein PP2-B10-like n=1 Tax=Mangifera indica TaxID=29780 RepID=UPI001CFB3D48|nr:F-box protein PP2-B10-like [Mangifera indica]
MDMSVVLPEECLSQIISLTSPRDACRLSAVSSFFKSIAYSDAVWERFLPSDYEEVMSNSASLSRLSTCSSKKDLYFHLANKPIFINSSNMSFGLQKESGKTCCMFGAKAGISVTWGSISYWTWPSLPESRFPEVAELKPTCWFEVRGKIETKYLSPETTYAAYLVYKFADSRYGFDTRPVELSFYVDGMEEEERSKVLLDAQARAPNLPQDRGDGWMEIEMGEFYIKLGENGGVMYSLFDFDGFSRKQGLIIEGFELRPKGV